MKISLFKGILLGVFGISALIGLFVFATYTNEGVGSSSGPVLIWGVLPAADMQAVLSDAVQADAAMEGVSYEQKDSATLAADLAVAIATGAAPDLILASQEQLSALAKFIMPIDPGTISARSFASTFIEGGRIFTAPDGAGYYGLPFLVDPLLLYANRPILSSSGIARPPATWEALTGLVPSVAELSPSRQITRGLIGLGPYANVRNARAILSSLFLQQGVPLSVYSPGTGSLSANLGLSTASGQPPGPAVLGFYTQFSDPSKVSYTWNSSLPDSQRAFLAGDLALYLGYASEARYLRSANPNLEFEAAPLPQPATASIKRAYGLVYALMIPRGAANPEGAFQAAVSLTGASRSAALHTGLAPAALTELTAPPDDPLAEAAYAETLYTRGWLSPSPADTDAVFSAMIIDVISGRSTPEAALASAERSLTSLLQK